MKSQTEVLTTPCHEQAIATNYMKAEVMKSVDNPKCRLSRTQNETIYRVAAGSPILAKMAYLESHSTVAFLLHWNIARNTI